MEFMKKIKLLVSLCFLMLLTSFVNTRNTIAKQDSRVIRSEVYFKGNVKVSNLMMGSNSIQEIDLSRKNKRIKAKYFAYDEPDIYNRLKKWKSDKRLVMLCSGAFTDGRSTPVGLTMDNGHIVNRNAEESMDGLVIVYATGGVVVSDIDEGDLRIQDGSKIVEIDVRNPKDKNYLLSWGEKVGATIFQTQLLAYDNELQITERGRKEKRERRVLVLAKHATGEVHHLIYNIPHNVYLFDIAQDIINFLQNEGNEIVAMLNLDTGSYDVLEFYRENGAKLVNPTGTMSVSKATNLLVYHFE